MPLDNRSPSSGVVIEANYHYPGHSRCPTPHFAGALAVAVEGLRAESSDCNGCVHDDADRVCVAVATGAAPSANSTLAGFRIALNTGDFATSKRGLKTSTSAG